MSEGREVSSLGNMDLAFFVSRKELIEWVNGLLRLNITKVEQCSNGAVYIQLLDMLFPNKSVLSKAKWNVKLEYECIMNYKLIQSTFNKLGVKKYMDVDKLIKGKYQDNLEFLQWFKGFFERVIDYNNEQVINYDPIERRKVALLGEKGDYKMLNNYLPEWAKLDSNTLKERILINTSRSVINNHNINIVNSDNNNNNNNNIYNVCKKNNKYKTNTETYQDVSTSSVGSSFTNTTNINNNSTTHNNNTINHNSNSNVINKKVLKPKKKSILANTMNDSMNTSYSNKYLSTHTKKHNINTNTTNTGSCLTQSDNYSTSSNINNNNINNNNINNNNINNSNSNKRSSASNKTVGRGSLSNYQTKNNTLDSRKEINLLIEQTKKLKTQLENKNQEILMFQNKLQEEECEKKILHFQKNFYYNKLRFLELLCNQTDENYILINDIQQIIYARENTYFHHTISLKNDKEDNEEALVHNNNNANAYNEHDLNIQHSVPNSETIEYSNQYTNQNSIDSSVC
ncbi:EB1 homolog, putative [Hepatocystis sp. ex Piliocolobus tephrosceles]|nr:EB1 homolog, putative [Hepatocystis sp. ex Piliocolobus tephrosceles]